MDIRIKYSSKEVDAILLEHHIKRFGAAPEGDKWHCHENYGTYTVENIKATDDEKE